MSLKLFAHPRIYTLEAAATSAHTRAASAPARAHATHTPNPTPIDGVIAVRDGRILFVGSEEDARAAVQAAASASPTTDTNPAHSASPATRPGPTATPTATPSASPTPELVRLPGAAIVPGFHDAHFHLGHFARSLAAPDVRDATSYDDVLARLRAYRPTTAWVTGGRWNRNAWADRTTPHRRDLDAIFGDTPAVLPSIDGHAAWANSAALRLANIDTNTPDPAGGRIDRDEYGEPTGILLEAAADTVRKLAIAGEEAALPGLLQTAQRMLLRSGLTHITEIDGEDVRTALLALHRQGDLRMRVHKAVRAADLPRALNEGRRTGDGDAMFTTGPVKFFSDGALGPHTAHFHEPYAHEPENFGIPTASREELADAIRRANAGGLACAIHAIGDAANTTVLDAYEDAGPTTLRNRIEHAQHLRPADVPRFARLGVVASMQPTHATSDYPLSREALGDRDVRHYPWRELLDAGAHLAFGSDCPVEAFEPMYGVHAAVTRTRRDGEPVGGREPEQALDVFTALRTFTLGSAYAAGLDHEFGTLAPGKHADFVALDHDPFTHNPADLWRIQPLATVVAGEFAYHAEQETS